MKWADIFGWMGFYQVSDTGKIRSLTRVIRVKDPWGRMRIRTFRGKVLKPTTTTSYHVVRLSRPEKQERVYIHDLVLKTFEGPKPLGLEVCHGNGVRTDNRLKNLRYGTRSENGFDRFKHARQRAQRK